jgi:hypothetical protein
VAYCRQIADPIRENEITVVVRKPKTETRGSKK